MHRIDDHILRDRKVQLRLGRVIVAIRIVNRNQKAGVILDQMHLIGRGICRPMQTRPNFGQAHSGIGIYHAKAIGLVKDRPPAVPLIAAHGQPCAHLGRARACAHRTSGVRSTLRQNGLHIAPTKARVGVQHQRHHARHHRCRRRCAAEGRRIVGLRQSIAVKIAGVSVIPPDPHQIGGQGRRRGGDQNAGPIVGIIRSKAGLFGSSHGDAMARYVGPIAIGVHRFVSGSFDHHCAQTAPANGRNPGKMACIHRRRVSGFVQVQFVCKGRRCAPAV